jgi:Xaa-Pro aminopeptidase
MSFARADVIRAGRLSAENYFFQFAFRRGRDLVDRIKTIKSPEEQDLIRRAAAMQGGAMRAVEPGMARPNRRLR